MSRRSPLAALVVAALAGSAVLAACSESDGRVLPEPDPAKTTTSVSAPVVPPGDAITGGGPFTVLSPSVQDGGGIPVDLTCFGDGVSPDLSWTGVPEGATSLALTVTDPDAEGFVHWIVTGIDPSVLGFGLDGVPEGATEGPNSAGGVGWTPPCPPKGSGTHRYVFQVYGMPADFLPTPTSDPKAVVKDLALNSLATATLTGTVDAPA